MSVIGSWNRELAEVEEETSQQNTEEDVSIIESVLRDGEEEVTEDRPPFRERISMRLEAIYESRLIRFIRSFSILWDAQLFALGTLWLFVIFVVGLYGYGMLVEIPQNERVMDYIEQEYPENLAVYEDKVSDNRRAYFVVKDAQNTAYIEVNADTRDIEEFTHEEQLVTEDTPSLKDMEYTSRNYYNESD